MLLFIRSLNIIIYIKYESTITPPPPPPPVPLETQAAQLMQS
jgi:hypothetical protein